MKEGEAKPLQPLVQEQCRFFDGLADLVDPKYYYSNDGNTVNLRYMKHSARAAAKSAFKEQKKKNKRAKLDPDAARTTTELQKAKHDAKNAAAGSDGSEVDSDDDDREDGAAAAPGPGSRQQAAAVAAAVSGGDGGAAQGMMGQLNISAGPAPSREDLMQRLQQKIEAARQERHAEEEKQQQQKQRSQKQQKQQKQGAAGAKNPSDQAKEWRRQQLGSNLKPKEQAAEAGNKRKQLEDGEAQQQQGQQQQQQAKRPKPAAEVPAAGQAGLVFSKLEVEEDKHKPGQQRKKKPTKEQILKAAEEKQKRLADAQAQPEGKEVVRQEAWQSAMQRARGEKVLDDPRLLRRSIKRESKVKERSAKKWQDRNKQQESVRDEKQQKRKTNLQARVTSKIEKKKARRDKKLLRAGFEGRKAGFIQPGSKGAGGKAAGAK